MKKIFTSFLLSICLLAALNVFSQDSKGYTDIIFTDDFTGDTTWSIDNIDFELILEWTDFWGGYLNFGGTFTTSFDNFDYQVYSFHMDVYNNCGECFEITLYKAGEDPVIIVPPWGYSIQQIDNPWYPDDNPDFVEVWTLEGGIKYETIYHDFNVGQRETEVKVLPYLSPNPAMDFIKINQIKEGSAVQIYNSVGKLILDFPFHSTDHRIDISSFKNGIYFITIINESNIQSLKFIKAGNK